MSYIAHYRSCDQTEQTVLQHLTEVGQLSASFASKAGLGDLGLLLGLLHDFGKYSQQFQRYIQSAEGLLDPDGVEFIDSRKFKGKIDHATAGAQYIYNALRGFGSKGEGELCGQILALCIASHHSGLIDTLAVDYTRGNVFQTRMLKEDSKTHLDECISNADESLIKRLNGFLSSEAIQKKLLPAFINGIRPVLGSPKVMNSVPNSFHLGMLTRFLFSCLIDADRLNSAEFDDPKRLELRLSKPDKPYWPQAIDRLETFLSKMPNKSPIDPIRREISQECLEKADKAQGIYSLTVPTGGGKTFASLRYALHHAEHHQLDRIIYIIPFTSIIEQNAADIREVLERQDDIHPWVLEHHSNIEPDTQTWHSKISSDNWDAPIVITTMVQFLEALFSGGTKSARRMHQLANSVLIFDEIQTLPVNCTHLFCNALSFLVDHAGSSAVLCTATQPLLNQLDNAEKGQLSVNGELIGDVGQRFNELKRVHIENLCKEEGWSEDEITDFALEQFSLHGSCLMIVNTKDWAKTLYQRCDGLVEPDALFHLSTNLCAAHRQSLFKTIRERLDNDLPVLCFSTQLIEAGVNVDFSCVIRFLAGLDSIAQAAGRCNRHGKQDIASVYVINPEHENTQMLVDIDEGKRQARRVMSESFDDLLLTEAMDRYFDYYFFQRSEVMDYPCKDSFGQKNTLLRLLSNNAGHTLRQNGKRYSNKKLPVLEQSFMEAGKLFQAIDAPTQAVLVPYCPYHEGELNPVTFDQDLLEQNPVISGKDLITELCRCEKEFSSANYYQLLRQAQKYSVNVFPNIWKKLIEEDAIQEIQPGAGVYYLKEEYYDGDFGLSTEPVSLMSNLIC